MKSNGPNHDEAFKKVSLQYSTRSLSLFLSLRVRVRKRSWIEKTKKKKKMNDAPAQFSFPPLSTLRDDATHCTTALNETRHEKTCQLNSNRDQHQVAKKKKN